MPHESHDIEPLEYRVYRCGQLGEKCGRRLLALAGGLAPILLKPDNLTSFQGWLLIGLCAFLGFTIGIFAGGFFGRSWGRMTYLALPRRLSSSSSETKKESETLAAPSGKPATEFEKKMQKASKAIDEAEKLALAQKISEEERKKAAADNLVGMKRAMGAVKEKEEKKKAEIPEKKAKPKPKIGPPGRGGGM